MNVSARLLTVNERDDVWMMEALENLYLGVKILFQLLVELVQVNRFDGDQ